MCMQFRDLNPHLIGLYLVLVSATTTATTTLLTQLPYLLFLHVGKGGVFIGPKVVFLNSAIFKLLQRWRLSTWLTSESLIFVTGAAVSLLLSHCVSVSVVRASA